MFLSKYHAQSKAFCPDFSEHLLEQRIYLLVTEFVFYYDLDFIKFN